MNTAIDVERHAHYFVVEGPRGWSDGEVARWLLALALRRDGRVDAVERADEILPDDWSRPDVDMADLTPRERGAFASAMYVAWSTLQWTMPGIGHCFAVQPAFATDVIAATASDTAEHPAFRAGITDISLAVREAWRVHNAFKTWGPK